MMFSNSSAHLSRKTFLKHSDFIPALAGFFRARHLEWDTVHVTLNGDTKFTAGGSKKRMVPAIPDGSRSVSLACRSSVTNFEPVA